MVFQAEYDEVVDALEIALEGRGAMHKAQAAKLVEAQRLEPPIEKECALIHDKVLGAQKDLEDSRHKIATVRTSCDTAVALLERQRHVGHMEAHAIEVALRLFSADV